jgi:hypothetical protein
MDQKWVLVIIKMERIIYTRWTSATDILNVLIDRYRIIMLDGKIGTDSQNHRFIDNLYTGAKSPMMVIIQSK